MSPETQDHRPRPNQRDASGHRQNFSERDLAETSIAATDFHPLDSIEPACDQPGYQARRTDAGAVWDVIRRLLGEQCAACANWRKK